MKRLPIILILIALLTASTIQAAPAAQTCASNWQAAINVIAAQCTQSINDNSVCYGHPTVQVDPARPEFFQPGTTTSVRGLNNVIISPQSGDDWGIAWFKLIAPTSLPGITSGQAVIFVAFGDTAVSGVQSSGGDLSMSDPGICTARLIPGSTTYGGSYMRVMPDPRFQSECVTPGCTDKDNLMHFVAEGAPLTVLAQRSDRSTVLVRDNFVTGWMTASPTFMDLSQCNMGAVPILTDSDLIDGLQTTSTVPAITSFYLTQQGGQTSCQDIPPGGLIAHDPTHQNIQFFVNGVNVQMGSTVFMRGDANGTGLTLMVLQGRSTVTKNGVSVSATRGDVIDALGQFPVLVQGGAIRQWCGQLSAMVAGAFPGIPQERWDYCATNPGDSPGVDLNTAYAGTWINDNPNSTGFARVDINFLRDLIPALTGWVTCPDNLCDAGTFDGIWEDGVRLRFFGEGGTTISAWLSGDTLYLTSAFPNVGAVAVQRTTVTETYHRPSVIG